MTSLGKTYERFMISIAEISVRRLAIIIQIQRWNLWESL